MALNKEVVIGQQFPIFNHYVENHFILNPASAGNMSYDLPVRLSMRKDWTGFDNAPKSAMLSVHKKLGGSPDYYDSNRRLNKYYGTPNHGGIGLILTSDQYGIFESLTAQLAYSYSIKIAESQKYGNTHLSFGLSITYNDFHVDQSNLSLLDLNDPNITNTIEQTTFPDANFGIYLYNSNLFLSLAIQNLFESSFKFEPGTLPDDFINQRYYVHGGYKYSINQQSFLEFSGLLNSSKNIPFRTDLNIRYFNRIIWGGFSYRTDNLLVAMFGVSYNALSISYSHSLFGGSTLGKNLTGTNEITLGIDIKKVNKRDSCCPAWMH